MKGDAVRLQQVITNLLQNAVKFTPAGGNILLSYKRRGPLVTIKVRDDGEGIEPEFLPLIFDRFSQADATTRRHNTGLGLGLTIVRNIVELHGGRTSAESDGPGTGTAITVELPLAEEFYRQRLSDDGARRPNGHSPSLDGFRILLVDDDPDSLLPLRILLEREKATVYCATSAEEALDRLWAQDFHILISDIGMPAVDGFQLITRLRKDRDCRNANIKAIAFTAYASEDDRQRVLSAGYHAHLAKPLDFDQLVEMIRNFSQLT
jgi:CheY-like chemotaxis protein